MGSDKGRRGREEVGQRQTKQALRIIWQEVTQSESQKDNHDDISDVPPHLSSRYDHPMSNL